MAKRVCFNCKWSKRLEDNFDIGGGHRVLRDCTHTDSPIMVTVVECASNPCMKEAKSFVHKFGCNLWEKK